MIHALGVGSLKVPASGGGLFFLSGYAMGVLRPQPPYPLVYITSGIPAYSRAGQTCHQIKTTVHIKDASTTAGGFQFHSRALNPAARGVVSYIYIHPHVVLGVHF